MRLFGIIGFPLGHSFSESYFTEKFRKENLTDHYYRKFELPSIEALPDLIALQEDLCGFNVTIPYKVKVINYLDEIDDTASEIGAVNTVRVTRRNGLPHLKGFNTDAPAFRSSLLNNLSSIPESAIVLGTGGASKSVTFILTDLGIRTVSVSRQATKDSYSYKNLPGEEISGAGLIVNTTPVGMAPLAEACPPLDFSFLREGQLLFDLIYNPPLTRFMMMGEEQGCIAVNGEEMFHIQAELAWGIWNDKLK